MERLGDSEAAYDNIAVTSDDDVIDDVKMKNGEPPLAQACSGTGNCATVHPMPTVPNNAVALPPP